MQDGDVARLKKVLSTIALAKARESLEADTHERLLAQLLQRSPKKTGTLFEVVMRDMHGMQRGRDVSHDAVHGNDRVEIKGSRVISQTDAAATNLFDCLLGEERFFAPVQQALTLTYDCNIQQVKARSFDRLLYCLYFSDAIVEFEMTSTQLQGFIDGGTGCTHVQAGVATDADGSTVGEAERRRLEKMQLAYSDFQHAGNAGEGQFHIKPGNLLFHLVRGCTNVYNYGEFAEYSRPNRFETIDQLAKRFSVAIGGIAVGQHGNERIRIARTMDRFKATRLGQCHEARGRSWLLRILCSSQHGLLLNAL